MTKCNVCGVTSNQPEGDGCHACLQGTMEPVEARNYTCINDPGHGWLVVPLADIKASGIADDISSCSYSHAGMVYLEEDCDYATFMLAVTGKGWAISVTERHVDHFVGRDQYNSYRPVVHHA